MDTSNTAVLTRDSLLQWQWYRLSRATALQMQSLHLCVYYAIR